MILKTDYLQGFVTGAKIRSAFNAIKRLDDSLVFSYKMNLFELDRFTVLGIDKQVEQSFRAVIADIVCPLFDRS